MLDSAWGKAFNLNLDALAAIYLPGDHFSPTGAYFAEDVVATLPAATDGEYALGDGVSTGVALDWERFERLGPAVFERSLSA